MTDAELLGADLQQADFSESELAAVSFRTALIRGASFTRAKSRKTAFGVVDDSNDFTGMTGTVLGSIRIHRDGDIIELSYSATENWFAERGAEISVVPPAGPLPTRARSTKGQD